MRTNASLARRVLVVGIFAAALGALPVAAAAQSATATLRGTTVDESGAVLPGATITVASADTAAQRLVVTGSGGEFAVPALRPGRYSVKAVLQGFATTELEVVVNVGDHVTLKVVLKLGTVSEAVTVTGDFGVARTTPAVSTVIDRRFVENLPLNGRSFQTLFELTPGVVLVPAGITTPGQFSVNGQRSNANYVMVDGVSANTGFIAASYLGQVAGGSSIGLSVQGGTNNLVSVDALEEFRLHTSTYAPEFGRMPGGQVSIVTRSGTNEFHGTLFDYIRNDAFDSNDWFANSRSLPKPPLRQNDFGGVLGGPIRQNRTFFFFSYEGLRMRQPQVGITEVPSLAVRQGAPVPLQPFLNAFPVPNGAALANGAAEFSASYADPQSMNTTSLRVDHQMGTRGTLFVRFNDSPSRSAYRYNRGLSTSYLNFGNTRTLTAGHTVILSRQLTNDLRVNWTHNPTELEGRLDDFGGAVVPPISAIPMPATPPDRWFLNFSVGAGLARLGNTGTASQKNLQRQLNIVDTVTFVTSAHNYKFGFDYRQLFPIFSPSPYGGGVTFTTANQALTGIATSASVGAQETVPFSMFNVSAYAQDTWTVRPRLTLTYGVRWDVNSPPDGTDREIYTVANLDDFERMDLAPEGTPFYQTQWTNIAPRAGLTYQLSAHPTWGTIAKGGYGIFYDLGTGNAASAAAGYPYNRSRAYRTIEYPYVDPSLAEPLPVSLTPPYGSLTVFDPEIELPFTHQWNVGIDQTLGARQSLSVAYVGALGRRLLRQETIVNPNPRFTSVAVTRNASESTYHSLQLQFQRRLSAGLQVLASYTLADSTDDVSNDSLSGPPVGRFDIAVDRGASDFDIRHSFSSAISYDFPAPGGRVGRVLAGGWSMDVMIRARSAAPFSVTVTRDLGFGSFAVRPDIVPGVPVWIDDPIAPGGRRLNREAFAVPLELRQGNLPRNGLRGFAARQLDLAIRREFQVYGRVRFQFRGELFNLFNTPNFGPPTGNLTSALFGGATQMLGRSLGTGGAYAGFNPLYQIGGPRSGQIALKLLF